MRDITEHIDQYCEEEYGHTNWAFADTLTKDELKDPNIAENDGTIVYYKTETL